MSVQLIGTSQTEDEIQSGQEAFDLSQGFVLDHLDDKVCYVGHHKAPQGCIVLCCSDKLW